MDKELIEKLEKHINSKLEKGYKFELPFDEFGAFSYELAQELEKLFAIHVVSGTCDCEIVDARNKVIESGYMCIKCGRLFKAHDH